METNKKKIAWDGKGVKDLSDNGGSTKVILLLESEAENLTIIIIDMCDHIRFACS